MKSVLVSYLERKKVFKIPEGEDNELSYLKEKFFEAFEIENGTAKVSFQYYSSEWDEYVELESFDVIENKAKLKAVITPVKPQEKRLVSRYRGYSYSR